MDCSGHGSSIHLGGVTGNFFQVIKQWRVGYLYIQAIYIPFLESNKTETQLIYSALIKLEM